MATQALVGRAVPVGATGQRLRIVAWLGMTRYDLRGPDDLQIKPSSGDSTLLISLMGEVVGHVKGSEKRDYLTDPLGSVVAYLNSSQTLTDQFEYWPYGELAGEIEAGVGPFLWVGSLGYFRDSDLRTYIRARTYRKDLGSWTQLDPLWPNEPAMLYAAASPETYGDPSGEFIAIVVIGAILLIGVAGCAPHQPKPRPKPRPGLPDLQDCMKECAKPGTSREKAACLAKCLARRGRNDLISRAMCEVYPELCEPEGRPPCEHVWDRSTCMDCCSEKRYVCMATTPPFGWEKCRQANTKCSLACCKRWSK